MQSHGWQQIAVPNASQAQMPPSTPVSSEQRNAFQPHHNNTRVFIFAFYDSWVDRPIFGGNDYRVDINGHYAGKFSDSQYIEQDMSSGKDAIDVYEYGWLGTLLYHVKSNLHVTGVGQVLFMAIDSYSGGISLSLANADFGMKEITSRKQATPWNAYKVLDKDSAIIEE